MKSLLKMIVASAVMAGGAALVSAPANAQVHVGIGLPGVHIGVGAPGVRVGVGAPLIIMGQDIIHQDHATPIPVTMKAIVGTPFTMDPSYWMACPSVARIIIAGSMVSLSSGIAATGIPGGVGLA